MSARLAVTALILANSAAANAYHKFWHTPVGIEIGTFRLVRELGHFLVNDVLMAIFFFVVGLEIKRELVAGELHETHARPPCLSSPRLAE